jgi:hypothetical protein
MRLSQPGHADPDRDADHSRTRIMSRRRLRIIENNGYSPWIVGLVLVVVVVTILLRAVL